MRLAAAKDEFTEILVVGDENPSLLHCPSQDIRIIGLGHCLSYGKHVMSGASQVFNGRSTGRLIYDELHVAVTYAETARGKTSS